MYLMTKKQLVFVVELKKSLLLLVSISYLHAPLNGRLHTNYCIYMKYALVYMGGMQALLQFGSHEPHWWMIIGILCMWLPR